MYNVQSTSSGWGRKTDDCYIIQSKEGARKTDTSKRKAYIREWETAHSADGEKGRDRKSRPFKKIRSQKN